MDGKIVSSHTQTEDIFKTNLSQDAMSLAWAGNIARIGIAFQATSYGAGVVHAWDIPLSHLFILLKVRISDLLPPMASVTWELTIK
jgi:hypothetical protein